MLKLSAALIIISAIACTLLGPTGRNATDLLLAENALILDSIVAYS